MEMRNERLARARLSLAGLSVGDAFGERFFVPEALVEQLVESRAAPAPPWRWTDDTAMAISIVEMLRDEGAIDPDRLNALFTERYFAERFRGYGPAMHGVFERIRGGEPYRQVIGGLFGGQGSYGNGSAMRVAPVGAYFADDLEAAVENARLSAQATHTHPEAEVGAIAVAVAAAYAWRLARGGAAGDLMRLVESHLPESEVRRRLRRAIDLDDDASVTLAASVLGSGDLVSAFDTVPFCLWCASKHLRSFTEAMWLTVGGLGDRDTTCAIVGGIVALSAGDESIPGEWLATREPLPAL